MLATKEEECAKEIKMSDRLKKEIEALDKEKALFEDDIERYQTQLAERERILETYD